MIVEESQKNIRCDSPSCNKFAKFSIITSGYKGNINLCEDCFLNLYQSMKSAIKPQNKTKENRK